jgi:glutathione synthase/RimK-type ligase-like ATP-grasp enzyme
VPDEAPAGGRADVTIVTHAGLPQGAPDDLILADALRRQGASVRFAVWDDGGVDWGASPVALVRSTWNYHRTPGRWLDWLARAAAATRLLNPPAVLRWNTDKRHLRDLMACGVPCVPTEFVEGSGGERLADLAARRGWADVVVKPAIAASAAGARRLAGAELAGEGEAHLRGLLARGAALVQPYLAAVETMRERSLVFVAGEFAHAFTKPAFSTSATGATVVAPHEPGGAELALARAALSAAPERTLYARADLVPDKTGPLLMELELIEPDLGLRLHPNAADRLARACLAHAR